MGKYKFTYPYEKREAEKKAKALKESKLQEFGDDMASEASSEKLFRMMYAFAKKQGIMGVRAQILSSDVLNIFYAMLDKGSYSPADERVLNRMIDKAKNMMGI